MSKRRDIRQVISENRDNTTSSTARLSRNESKDKLPKEMSKRFSQANLTTQPQNVNTIEYNQDLRTSTESH